LDAVLEAFSKPGEDTQPKWNLFVVTACARVCACVCVIHGTWESLPLLSLSMKRHFKSRLRVCPEKCYG